MVCILLLVAAIMYITVPYMPSHIVHLYMSVDSLTGWLLFIHLFLDFCIHICVYTCRNFSRYGLRSQDFVQMQVPRVKTELGKKAFKFSAPSTWNDVQKDLRLTHVVALGENYKRQRIKFNWILSLHCVIMYSHSYFPVVCVIVFYLCLVCLV